MAERSIPLASEIIVQIAFRYSGDELSQHTTIDRFRVRTISEMEEVVEAIRDRVSRGTLSLVNDFRGGTLARAGNA